MTTATLTRPEELVAGWRTSAEDNPAGPLFSTRFTESELTSVPTFSTACSACTGSHTADCC